MYSFGEVSNGDVVEVQLIEIDPKTGKLRLSRKPLIPKPEGYVEPPKREPRERRESHEGGDSRGGRHDHDHRDNRSHDRRRDDSR